MRKNLYAVVLFLIVLTSDITFGKESNKTKLHKPNKKLIAKENAERLKRSLDDEDEKPFWANRGKKKIQSTNKYGNDLANTFKVVKRGDYSDKEPFWGMRGRRESTSSENSDEYPEYSMDSPCKHCFSPANVENSNYKNFKDRRDESYTPFWGNRGRRSSDEIEDPSDPFWGTRGRRFQNNDPFRAPQIRGHQKEEPFWGARGRREEEPFWGNRGRRDDEPFWGNRGRRQDSEPFWGNRGRRQESEPFWGQRGRRDDEPFWGNRGRRRESEPFWGNQGRRKEDLKDSIMKAIDVVENDIRHLARLKRSEQSSFWSNRGRDSKLKQMFNTPGRNRLDLQPMAREYNMDLKLDPSTVHDSRIFADEPHYIVVERSSRSSAEAEDPFFISRGKKYYVNYNLIKAARDRRGAIEEIVKSVRNDPYYIARGKKDTDQSSGLPSKIKATSEEDIQKAKDLICSAIELIINHHDKVKREIDSDRDRRTILKKLAAQLQIDPYYVSRGKKSDDNITENNLREFITAVAERCN